MYFDLPDLSETQFVYTYMTINNNKFKFTFRWNEYCNCAFMNIKDSDETLLLDDTACVNGLKIRLDSRVLPVLELVSTGDFPPTKETFKDYAIQWEE